MAGINPNNLDIPYKEMSLSPDSYVIVRAWAPTNNGQVVSYSEALFRRTFTPSNEHNHIGHVAITIRDGDREQYVSLYPTEAHYFTTSPAINNTLEEDIKAQENLPPAVQAILFSLDTKKMLEKFDTSQANIRWFLSGNKYIYNSSNKEIYNCSSYVEQLLTDGGIYKHLLTPHEKLSLPMTPLGVCDLAKRASVIEKILYPETEITLKKFLQTYCTDLVEKSKNAEDPCVLLDAYIKEHPDFHLCVNEADPKALATTLSTVYRNIQQKHNEHLLQRVEQFNLNDEFCFLIDVQKLLETGASLSIRNKDGYNALHLMIKHHCYEGVALILDKFPQAANDVYENNGKKMTPLDLAIAEKDKEISKLIMKRGGMTTWVYSNFHDIKNLKLSKGGSDPRLFSSKDKLNDMEIKVVVPLPLENDKKHRL